MTEILDEVLKYIPESAKISDSCFEGANIVLYTKDKEFFLNNNGIIKKIVDTLKKRVELRPDPSICLDMEEAKTEIEKIIPQEAKFGNILFDPQRSIVTIEAEKPGLAIGKQGDVLKEIRKKTLWVPIIRRTPAIRSKLIENIRQVLYENNDYRKKFLNKVGHRIYDGWLREKKHEWVRVSFLGGARQVGRSCLFLQTPESRILLDCGVNVAASDEDMYPLLDAPEFDINELDAIICTHPHLDHCLPPHSLVLTEEGYKKIDDIKMGEKIISLDWKTGKYIKSKCIEKTKTMGHKKILTIKTPYSRIESSPNHRFFTFENMKLIEIEASKLKKGMLLPSNLLDKPRLKGKVINLDKNVEYDKRRKDEIILPEKLTTELAEFIAYYMGDGHKSSEFSLRLTDSSTQILNHHKNIIKDLFNFEAKIKHHPDKTKNAFILEINNVKIIRFLEKNFPEAFLKTKKINIPEKIINSHQEIQRAFLRGFADAEGTVTKIVKICSFSKKMLEDLQYLFSSQGIPSNIKNDDTICLNSKFSIYKFYKKIGFSIVDKQNKLENLINKSEFNKQDLIPITGTDLRNILKQAGMFGSVHNSPRLVKILPMGLLDLFRRKQGYATRKTIIKLIPLLEYRLRILNSVYSDADLYALRQLLSITRVEVSTVTGLKIHQIQQIEEGKLLSESFVNILASFIREKLSTIICQTKQNIKILQNLFSLNLIWERINDIKEEENQYPYLVDIEVENHNFVAGNIIVHNSGFIPFLYKMGYRGPLYCTSPCRDVTALLALDYIGVAFKQAKKMLYSSTDIKEMVKHTICLDYEEVSDITPDVRLTLYNAGHTLGSAMLHLHIGNGLHNLLYTGDLKYLRTHLLEPASTRFPRLETVIIESTYGSKDDILPSRKKAEEDFINIIKETMQRNGKVLIPVLGVGRAQEVLLILEDAVKNNMLEKIPIYIQGMVWDVTAIHTAYPDFLNRNVRKSIFHKDKNPFLSDMFLRVGSTKEQQEIIEEKGPCVIIATAGMLNAGASVEYFKQLADNPKNSLIFVCYQGEGSLGRRIQSGEKDIPMSSNGKQEIVKVKMQLHTISALTGHAGRNELIRFIYNLEPKPKRIIINHGESSKCLELASDLHKMSRVETSAPKNLEAVRIK